MAPRPKDVDLRLAPLAEGFGNRVNVAALRIGTRPEAAAAMGLSDDQLGRIIKEKAVPTLPAIAGLAKASGCTLEWLAFDQGSQFAETSFAVPIVAKVAAKVMATTNYDSVLADTVLVPRYDVRFSAGPGASGGDDRIVATLPFSRRYLEGVLRCALDDVAIGEADGDSMEPTIGDGDLLMVHLKRKRISDGHIFVLRLADELVVKRVQRELDGSLILMSDNKAYADRRLTQAEADQVDVIGRLIWSGGPV